MTTFTKTPPTEPGLYYWCRDNNSDWHPVKIYQLPTNELSTCGIGNIKDMPGEWGGRVPAPGTTWTVEQIEAWMKSEGCVVTATLITDKYRGIAATTARHRKE